MLKLTRRRTLAVMGGGLATLAGSKLLVGPARAADRITVLNWQGYGTDESWAIEAFTAETGIEVVHDYFNSEAEMLTKLRTNPGVYDVVLINSARSQQAAGEDLLTPLDLANYSNASGLAPALRDNAYLKTDGKLYGVSWVWGMNALAIRDGMAFVATVFKGNPTKPDHELIPTAIFTQPEMGTVGLSEEDARDQEPIEVYTTSFKPMQQSFAGRAERVLMKLIVSQANRKVLGCHIVAPGAGEMIQLAGIAIKMGATKEDFDRTVAVHPTMSEELVTMKTPVRTG